MPASWVASDQLIAIPHRKQPETHADASVRCVLNSFKEPVICVVPCQRECGIQYLSFDMNAKVHLEHVALSQHYKRSSTSIPNCG